MRVLVPLALLVLALPVSAAEPPLVEQYLHSGQLVLGEQVLERELKKHPKDDQLRFGLGVIRLALGIERLGQALHEYGANTQWYDVLLGNFPIPKNPEPNAITYQKFRHLLDDARRGMIAIEATLAGITDDKVQLPLRLAKIKLDLDGDGKATDSFLDLLARLMRRTPDFLKSNTDFLVCFDRGDVAWLRSYCHVIAGLIDTGLAFDFQAHFELIEDGPFPRVVPKFTGTKEERTRLLNESQRTLRIVEPARLSRVREHFLAVTKLNRETWRQIRAETDNNHEWLPNSKQQSVIGLPVRDELIDGWLEAMGELEAILEGKSLLPVSMFLPTGGRNLNMKTLLNDPPATIDIQKIFEKGIDDKYLEKGPVCDIDKLLRILRLFDSGSMGMYMAYFN